MNHSTIITKSVLVLVYSQSLTISTNLCSFYYRCVSDATVLYNTRLYQQLIDEDLNLPAHSPLSGNHTCLPFTFVGGNLFGVNAYIVNLPLSNTIHTINVFLITNCLRPEGL